MAALTRPAQVVVRAAFPGEGTAIAALWRQLWDAHEAWGGYPGSRDPRVYAQLAHRLDDDVRVRGGHPILGRHIHLVADLDGTPCGQVEGWFDRQGVESPYTCEVRSLIVTERVRGLGAGRALLDALGGAARSLSRESPCIL
ncbi:MAG TPA: GNAT family N-acetyltransferase, partial [Polyangiaceae bacterium]|nr:GNAT family N-acetyltransferase [Polyangiaceae bacterium]